MSKIFFSLLLLAFCFSAVYAQPATNNPCDPRNPVNNNTCPSDCVFPSNVEKGCNCFDGIDNDGDGRIDAADPNCAAYYGLEFLGSGSDCSITPQLTGGPFDFINDGASSQNTSDTQSRIAVGDVDGDGIPDIITTSKSNKAIRVLATTNNQADGKSIGDEKSIYKDNDPKFYFELEIAIADINGNGKGEMFSVVSERKGDGNKGIDGYYLVGYSYTPANLTPLWPRVSLGTRRPGILGIADFDGDGKAEIYFKDNIYAAETGKLLARGITPVAEWNTKGNAAPVAVDIVPGGNMELISGNYIYAVPNLTNRNPATPATLTVIQNMNDLLAAGDKYFAKLVNDLDEYGPDNFSSTSVADFDGDGNLDVFLSGARGSENGKTAVYYWNVAQNRVSIYEPPDGTNPNGWAWGTGRVNLGDANGDGKLNATFVAGNRLFCLTSDASDNLTPLWPQVFRQIEDSRSGVLGLTIYDFDNDGIPSIVYRDSKYLTVFPGNNPLATEWQEFCQSHTWMEHPIVVDVDGNGATDLVTTCYFSNNPSSFKIDAKIQQQALGQVRQFYSAENAWLPTRKVWNQHGYFVVNINDDLTLPFPQIDQLTVFGNDPCPNGRPGPQVPLNMFMNQVPTLGPSGCPIFPAPDLTFIGDNPDDPNVDPDDPNYFPAVVVRPPICGNLDLDVFFNITNSGDLPISDQVPVAFFDNDPTLDPPIANLLHTTTLQVTNLQIGDTLVTPATTFNGPGSPFKLYIVLYSDGTGLPLPAGGQSAVECDIANNIYSIDVNPTPFDVEITVVDNFKCDDNSPNSGELEVIITKGGELVTDYSELGFQWYSGLDTSTPIAGATAYNLLGVAEGDYTVVVTNTAKNCGALPVSASVARQGFQPEITLQVLSNQTQCDPPDGKIQATITGGELGYNLEWFDASTGFSLGFSGTVADNLFAGEYSVVVSREGCFTNAAIVVEGPEFPDVEAEVLRNVTDCLDPNSGEVTARAVFNLVVQDPNNYEFNWYVWDNVNNVRGSILPAQYGTGPTRTGLPAGFYQVEITENATQCKSTNAAIVQVVNATEIPEVEIVQLAPQTSCDPATPNGSLQAIVRLNGVVQDPALYTFEWFRGDNTLPANLHTSVTGTNGNTATAVPGGGVPYTAKATSALNCFNTNVLIIEETLLEPVLTLAAIDNGICDPAFTNPARSYSGEITASVTVDGNPANPADYTFRWYTGTIVDPANLIIEAAGLTVLDELAGGYYTVEAIRTDVSCAAIPKVIEVENIQDLPDIEASSSPSTNCDPAFPNGSAQVTDVNGLGTGSPFVYEWYAGNTASGTVISTDPVASNIQGGIGLEYTVLVTNQNNGCQNTVTLAVGDQSVLPVISLQKTDNDICDPALTNPARNFGGTATATIQNPIGGATYDFTWYNGVGTGGTQLSGNTNQIVELEGGQFYTAALRHIESGCISDPVSIEINFLPTLPVIVTTVTPSTNCDPALANGSLAAQIDLGGGNFTTAGYTFQWFDGQTTAVILPGQTSPTLSNVMGDAGNVYYTVQVIDPNTGCSNTQTSLLPDERLLPIITLAETDNFACDPALANGSIVATLTNEIAGHTYVYNWFTGNLNTNPADQLAGITINNITQRTGSFYTARIINQTTGCLSDPVSEEIRDILYIPDIVLTKTNQTSCDPTNLNSLIVATIDETNFAGGSGTPGITAGYTFSWVDENAVGYGTNNNIAQIPGNLFYTVSVVHTSTGCDNQETIFLPEIIEIPFVQVTVTDIVDCNTPGQIEAEVLINGNPIAPAAYADYAFSWFRGNTTDPANLLIETSRLLTQLDNGDELPLGQYTVLVENITSGCKSQDISDLLNGPGPLFTIDFTINNRPASCAVNEGAVTAEVNGDFVINYTFEWYQGYPTNAFQSPQPNFFTDPPIAFNGSPLAVDDTGVDVTGFVAPFYSPTSAFTGPTLYEQSAGAYTVVVTRNSDQCKEFATVVLPYLDEPVIILEEVRPGSCNLNNGEIDVEISIPATQSFPDYDAFIYSGPNPDLGVDVPVQSIEPLAVSVNTFAGLAPGIYTVVVQENFGAFCYSTPLRVELATALPPLLELVSFETSSSCGIAPGDGSLEITFELDPLDPFLNPQPPIVIGAAPTYQIDVVGSISGNVFSVGGYASGAVETIPDLRAESYTVTITSSENCETTKVFNVPNAPAIPQLLDGAVAISNAEFCDLTLETSARVVVNSLTLIDGTVEDRSNYNFEWFSNAGLTTLVYDDLGTPADEGYLLENPKAVTTVTNGSYWVRVTKVIASPSGGEGCFSAPFRADILDMKVIPDVTLTASGNSACDGTFEGSIVANVVTASGPGSAANYNYAWSTTSTTNPVVANPYNGNANSFTGLQEGSYTLTALNNITGCQRQTNVSILSVSPPVFGITVNALNQTICAPNGAASIVDVLVNGASDNTANFDYQWFVGSVGVGNELDDPGNPGNPFTGLNINTLVPGTYFIKSVRNTDPGSGCESAPVRFDVFDESENPAISFATVANTSCDNNFDGQITVTASHSLGGNYDFTWQNVPTGAVVANAVNVNSPYTTLAGDVVAPGTYTLLARNLVSQCENTGFVTVLSQPQPIDILDVVADDQLICYADGRVEVLLLSTGSVSDFSFEWRRGNPNNAVLTDGINPITGALLQAPQYADMGAGTYYVVAIKNTAGSSGCRTAPFRKDVFDLSDDPTVDFSFTPNSSCDLSRPNGTLIADALERDGTNTDLYDFAWLFNGAAFPPEIGVPVNSSNNSTVNAAADGSYTITVTNNSRTGCSFTTGFNLKLDQTMSIPNIIDVDKLLPFDCLGSGEAAVVSISIGGGPAITDPIQLASDFEYEWYNTTFPGTPRAETVPQLTGLLAGKYFVLVKDLETNCVSIPKEVVLDDTDIVLPAVNIRQTALQISCIADMGTAELRATGDGQIEPNYTFTWYNTLNQTGNVIGQQSTLSGILAGEYSVNVLSNITGCENGTFFVVPDQAPLYTPRLSVGSEALNLCVGFDGLAFTRVINFDNNYPFPYDLTTDLYFTGSPDFNAAADIQNIPALPGFPLNFSQGGLNFGAYTFRILDNNTGCIGTASILVQDNRINPVPEVMQENPLTNCDPARANGQLLATADGGKVGGYEFLWFRGQNVTDVNNPLTANNRLISQGAGVYVVRVTNDITGCFADANGEIKDETVVPPTPNALVLSDRFNCEFPDGQVGANVNGIVINHIFNWYDGPAAANGIDFTGPVYRDLDIGPYTVTATDINTGCVSQPRTVIVQDRRLVPEVGFDIFPSRCLAPTGALEMFAINEFQIRDVVWIQASTGVTLSTSAAVYNQPDGLYIVQVTSTEGCFAEVEVNIPTEITSYNGISANGDGLNDFFEIDCIDRFPNNNVKIFNRTGVKVYEADGYNNRDVIFRGVGERGVYMMGRELPDGTYFYIIDKRDGSKPIAGYLELIR